MVLRIAVVNAPTTGTPPVSNTISVGSGIGSDTNPVACIYEITGATTNNAVVDTYRYGIGITDGTTQRVMSGVCEDAQNAGTADCDIRHDTASVINFPNTGGGGLNSEASWSSWVNGGSKVLWNDLPDLGYKVRGTYFVGSDVSAAVVDFTGAASLDGTASVTGLAFTPNFVCVISHYTAFVADSQSNNIAHSIGYAVKTKAGAIQQACFVDFNDDRGNASLRTDGASVLRDDAVAAQIDATTDGVHLELTTWGAAGATFTTRNGTTGLVTAMLFARFAGNRDLQCTIETIPMDTSSGAGHGHGADTFAVECPFVPVSAIVIATDLEAKNATTRSALRSKWSSGVVDGDNGTDCLVSQAEENAIVSDTRSLFSTSTGEIIGDAGSDVYFPFSFLAFDTDAIVFAKADDGSELPDKLGIFVLIGAINTPVSDTEAITDQVVMIPSHVRILTETVAISDNVVLIVKKIIATETVEISDIPVLVTGTAGDLLLVFSETVEIQEPFNFSGAAKLVFSETEAISDSPVVLNGNLIVVGTETVAISDQFARGEPIHNQSDPRGTSAQGGAEAGSAFSAHAERGSADRGA